MKKIIAVLIVFCITASLFALEEVRGVQTKITKYPAGDTPKSETKYEGYEYNYGNPYYGGEKPFELAGFELKNENNYPVWVELELYRKPYSAGNGKSIVPESVVATKNITLQAGESYLWKTNILVSICNTSRCEQSSDRSCTNNYFIKYKAYKADTGKK